MSDDADVFDVVVDGGDAASLYAARECARFGFRVAVIDDPQRWMFIPQDFNAYGGEIQSLCAELNLDCDVSDIPAESLNVVGIPVNPFSPQVRNAIGWSGAWRVYLDRLRPLLQLGNDVRLDVLIRRRLGAKALNSLVLPELGRQFGIESASISINSVAPGLPEAMSRVGSLTGGALELIATHPEWAQRVRIVGGTQRLMTTLNESVEYFAVQRVSRERSESLTATVWILDVATSPEQPSWEQAIGRARAESESARTVLLSDPENPPVGPIDLGR